VTDASWLTGPGPWATWCLASSPGKTPLSAPAAAGPGSPSGLPPRPDGDPDDPRSPPV